MNRQDEYSNEAVSAYVDGELEREERIALLQAASRSAGLAGRICEAGYLKELVQGAYQEPEKRVASRAPRGSLGGWTGYAAAATLGAVAVFAGLQIQDAGRVEQQFAGSYQPTFGGSFQPAGMNQGRVVFHISVAEERIADELLDQVELVLQSYAREGRALKVEVVANNEGLRILQQGRSPVAERIRQLDDRYQNLMFAACGNTLQRFRKENGEQIEILPQAVIVQSGVSFVVRRQKEGWAYIKV